MNNTGVKLRHILYLIDELKVKGGTEKHLYELSTGMADAGHRVTVFALAEGLYAKVFRDDPRIEYGCLNVARIYDGKGISAILKVSRYIRNQHVDIVQSFHTAADLVGPLAARLSFRRTRVFSSRRDLGYTKSRRHTVMQRYVNFFVDGILANSQAVKQTVLYQECFPAERITVIYNGINIEPFTVNDVFRQQQRQLLGVCPDTIVIGSVGNIRPVKGYDIFVEAAGIVCRENPHVHFCHVGAGEMKEQLEIRCQELGIEKKFSFLGSTRDVPAFLSGLDIYVQPSRSEGLSNAIIEAMAARLPVIATDVGGNPDLIDSGVNGVLVPLNETDLAQQLLNLAGQPEFRKRLGSCAYEKVLDKFQMSAMLHGYHKFYAGGLLK